MVSFDLPFGFPSIPPPLVWFIAGLYSSIIVSFITRFLIEWYYRPRLDIINQSFNTSDDMSKQDVKIKNSGKSAAENCTGRIIVQNLSPQDLSLGNPLGQSPTKTSLEGQTIDGRLCWKRNRKGATTINGDDTERLHICCWHDKGVVIPSTDGFSHPSFVLSPNKDQYFAQLNITTANGSSTTQLIEITPEGVIFL